MDRLRFGTGGTPNSAKPRTSVGGIRRLRELGLDSMELEFVQGVRMGEVAAAEVREVAQSLDIKLTAHGPYYINLNSPEPDKLEASRKRIVDTAVVAALCGAHSITFHAAAYMKDSPEDVYERVKRELEAVVAEVRGRGITVQIRPEVAGKSQQFGTLEELITLSEEIEGILPCIDFAHWHARTGRYNSYDEFMEVFEQLHRRLGPAIIEDMHAHVAGVKYGSKGEISHLPLQESDLQYRDLLRAFKNAGAKGIVVCESPILEEDALLLQQTYAELS